MRIRRTISPAAAPLGIREFLRGLRALFFSRREVEEREHELRMHFHVRHVFLLSSGKAALAVLLRALARVRPERDEVVIPAYTCYSVPSAIVRAGLRIVPCDLLEGTTDLDPAELRRKVTDRTLCVVPTHLFGFPADLPTIRSIAREHSVWVIEDAAQAMGGTVAGGLLGTLGDAGVFSLGRGKNVTSAGGGVIVTNDDRLADAVRNEHECLQRPGIREGLSALASAAVMSIFIRPVLYWLPAGLPFLKLGKTLFVSDFPLSRLSNVQAGLLSGWEDRLERHNATRRVNALDISERIADVCRSFMPLNRHQAIPVCLRYPMVASNGVMRDQLVAADENRRAGISIMYPLPVSEIAEIRERFTGQDYPVAKDLSRRLFTVPTHPLVAAIDRNRVLRILLSGAVARSGETVMDARQGTACYVAEEGKRS